MAIRYNGINNLYSVRDSDAHAWVEVKTPLGWRSFDPTSSQRTRVASQSGIMSGARHLLEYIEFSYANAIVAYGQPEPRQRDRVARNGHDHHRELRCHVSRRIEDFLAAQA